MVKQLQYGYREICNVIQSWISWNYSVIWINCNIVTVYCISVTCDIISYTYGIWIIIDAIPSDCILKLWINYGGGYNLDENKIIGYSLYNNITIVFIFVNYCKFISNIHTMGQFYQIVNKILNFRYTTCMGMILSVLDTLHNIFCHELHTNNGDACELIKNEIIQCTSYGRITNMVAIVKYNKFATKIYKMNHFYQIDNLRHNSNQTKTIIRFIDTIAHRIKSLIAIYVIIAKILVFSVTYGTCILIWKFNYNVHSNTTYLFLFFLIMHNMDNLNVIICMINTIFTIIAQMACIYIILLMVAFSNAILIGKLDTKRNASKIIWFWFVFSRDNIIVITVIYYKEFDISICEMKCYCDWVIR